MALLGVSGRGIVYINLSQWCRHSPHAIKPIQLPEKLLAAKGALPGLAPSPEAAGHPFKRKDVGFKANLWREV
ncbi:hypothetical protein Taro_053002 [Colocasia esculenta]|uniref:Uncharacterized protein n=1 Tax=Colocasia esculenta TaxID=4460 RepID=A0A843XJS0_COLES|nr:hypothetical protein [Colocasia esculenta]